MEAEREERGAGRAFIELKGVVKDFGSGGTRFRALKGISLELDSGEFVAIIGRSGSGKSTLLNIMTGIDSPSAGEVRIGSAAIHGMGQEELARWRGGNVGVVFQFFQLLPTLTVLENAMLPMEFLGRLPSRARRARALELLERFGVADQARKLPTELSGGQQQRAAIARALANDPPAIFADEPTGNLDSESAFQVMRSFSELSAEGKTVVMVTHERETAGCFTRRVRLADGELLCEVPEGRAEAAAGGSRA